GTPGHPRGCTDHQTDGAAPGLPIGAALPGSPVPAPPPHPTRASATARRYSPATSQPSSHLAANLLPPFPLWPALPASEYYGGSGPTQGHSRRRACPPPARLAGGEGSLGRVPAAMM